MNAKPNDGSRFWIALVVSIIGLIVMGSAAGGRMGARIEICETKIDKTSVQLEKMADDVSYMRGRFDMLLDQQSQRKRGAK